MRWTNNNHHDQIVSLITDVVVTAGCAAAISSTGPAGLIACGALGEAASTLTGDLWRSQVEHTENFNLTASLKRAILGAGAGALGAAIGVGGTTLLTRTTTRRAAALTTKTAADTGSGNFVYRALNAADREAVDAGLGITAKNPEGTWSLGDHVTNGSSRASWSNAPWIATSRDPGIAAAFDSGHGAVRINLDMVDSPMAEAWKVYPRVDGVEGLPYHYSSWQQEVSIFGSIPPGAIG